MSSEFFFSLLRVSCAQILRAAGLERCSPSVLDTFTDLCVKHLELLSDKAEALAELSGRNDVILADLALAMEMIGLIRPVSVVDPDSPEAILGYKRFVDWVKGPVAAEEKRISRIDPALQPGQQPLGVKLAVTSITSADTTATAVNDTVSTASDTNNIALSTEFAFAPIASSVTRVTPTDWLAHLMQKQVTVGHEDRFNGTILGPESEIDSKIAGPQYVEFDL